MNVTGLRLIDLSNQTAKAFHKAWQGLDSAKWSGSGQSRLITVRFVFLLHSFNNDQFGFVFGPQLILNEDTVTITDLQRISAISI